MGDQAWPRMRHRVLRNSVKKEASLATILVVIVVVFMVCNTPRVLLNCHEFLASEQALLRCFLSQLRGLLQFPGKLVGLKMQGLLKH